MSAGVGGQSAVPSTGNAGEGSGGSSNILERLYKEQPGWTVTHRFGQLDGKLMQEAIFQAYTVAKDIKVERIEMNWLGGYLNISSCLGAC